MTWERMGSLPSCWNDAAGGWPTDVVMLRDEQLREFEHRAFLFRNNVLIIEGYGARVESTFSQDVDCGEFAFWGAS